MVIAGRMRGRMIVEALMKACSSLWALEEVVHHNYWAHAVGLVVALVRLLAVGVVADFVVVEAAVDFAVDFAAAVVAAAAVAVVVVVAVVVAVAAAVDDDVVVAAEAQVVASFVVVRRQT